MDEPSLRASSRLPPLPPRWDQSSLLGRFRHFASVTSPLLCLKSGRDVEAARRLLLATPPGGEGVWEARRLCAAALHPDTGLLQSVPGRMCFQVPGGMALIAAMSVFQGSTGAVLFWQWANQSFNAFVNYTNRSGEGGGRGGALAAYCCATGAALAVSVLLRRRLSVSPGQSHALKQRLVPLAAVLAANCVNIPLMRGDELVRGVCLRAGHGTGEEEVRSRLAAALGISQVVVSRCVIVSPGMLLLPWLEHRWLAGARARVASVLLQTLAAGVVLLVTVPLGCALFPQQCAIRVDTLRRLEPAAYRAVERAYPGSTRPDTLYFNKGL